MPGRYLGIPLAAKRLSVTDYSPLVDQIATAVIEKIHWLCRAFLWNSKRASVAWEEICHPKEEDTLWVKWVNEVYLRGASLCDWQLKKNDSPLLQRLADICNRVVSAFGSSEATIQHMAGWSNTKGLQKSKAYEYFRLKLTRQPWKGQFEKNLSHRSTHSYCGLDGADLPRAKHLFFECSFSDYV
ncbi:UNVERIFIED_CONTAM: hypothetical protein Slati_0081200 [Sesamum latifolium]|uniref:Reverse transcriptase zinc-binding domain-containing protein n=1 Tax=Sesamum latifolium TaxID=2727402 RepID=A0AAW2Y813_9LAMI